MSPSMIIFLPVRNGGSYLREAIGSVVAQDDPEWRLVVLENGSADDTVATVRSFEDPRIDLLSSDSPLNIGENWHRIWQWLEEGGFERELVTTIGHDDYLNPGFVSRMRRLAAEYPQATLYQAAFDLIDESGGIIRPCRPVPDRETWQGLAAALCWGIRDSFGTGYVFRARDYRQVGGIPPFPNLLYADHLLFIRLTRLGHKQAVGEALCRYRLHTGSASNNFSGKWVNIAVEGFDMFVTALMGELEAFVRSEVGRNAAACLLGRQLAVFDRTGMRAFLTSENKARLARHRTLFAALSSGIPPGVWADQPKRPRWRRDLQSFATSVSLTRVRVSEWLAR